MTFLYQKLESLREFGNINELPDYIATNLNQEIELRPYQRAAFENYITWFESDKRPYPIQNLFHMSTGSGKTLIMAGLILYLYKKGYRNFLFFVNLSTIVEKTKDNFLNSKSSKYLFSKDICIDGERVFVREVKNFQNSDERSINICFTTIQGLHSDIWTVKENALSFDDFESQKIVFISDEAHHLNADTKKLKGMEAESYHSWESTVRNIFERNRDNILLEFTATCDLANPNIKAEYENKIIFDYPLSKFREDGYSKEIKTLRCDISIMDRAIQAIVLSQYRLKVFQDNRLSIKPVLLFKSAKIAESKENMETFIKTISKLTGNELERISKLTDNETMLKVWGYFEEKGISFDQLAQELKDDFSQEHCISANDDKEADEGQLALNSLEDTKNPYRAVFEVKKLDEGWDVLNLFDIVRMYETRQSSGKNVAPATVAEAQLIGRGSRYCPFKIEAEQSKFLRKYDKDLDNPLRICEELYYHCQNDSRYISELNRALRDIGIDLSKVVTRDYVLKEKFKKDSLYTRGLIFTNNRIIKSRNSVFELLPSVRSHLYTYSVPSGSSAEDTLFGSAVELSKREHYPYPYKTTIAKIAELNYSIVHKAVCKYPILKFSTLKKYYPNLTSTREFIFGSNYLGDIKIEITSCYEKPTPKVFYDACVKVLNQISEKISGITETYEGSREFSARYIHDIFKDKKCNYTDPHDGGIGISQNDHTVTSAWKIDLSKEDWYAFEDNFGTSEEKAFVAFFKRHVETLSDKYDKVYLIRNERQFHIYSFDGGERFEPDYVLFLHSRQIDGYEQLQVFIEPKGSHLIATDKWKEDFLLQLEAQAIPIVNFADENNYKIWGLHFFNRECRDSVFETDMARLM